MHYDGYNDPSLPLSPIPTMPPQEASIQSPPPPWKPSCYSLYSMATYSYGTRERAGGGVGAGR